MWIGEIRSDRKSSFRFQYILPIFTLSILVMKVTKKQYIMDEEGKKVAVILPIKKYEMMLEDLEMKEDIALYDKAKKGKQVFVDAKDAFAEIDSFRIALSEYVRQRKAGIR